jgi:hypothetical protein
MLSSMTSSLFSLILPDSEGRGAGTIIGCCDSAAKLLLLPSATSIVSSEGAISLMFGSAAEGEVNGSGKMEFGSDTGP